MSHVKKNRGLVYSTGKGSICPECSEPVKDCLCGQIPEVPSTNSPMSVRREKKGRAGKTVTVIYGISSGKKEISVLAADLKRNIGTGGTVREDSIEIQGDHVDRILTFLSKKGYTVKRTGG